MKGNQIGFLQGVEIAKDEVTKRKIQETLLSLSGHCDSLTVEVADRGANNIIYEKLLANSDVWTSLATLVPRINLHQLNQNITAALPEKCRPRTMMRNLMSQHIQWKAQFRQMMCILQED
ncbi:hypothetical protein BT93_H0119 [Corymbia citriodora subsp. variegata]|nr:hypothetical protein BT93_H0119 [Corymbia citriodora subsp. variegata]